MPSFSKLGVLCWIYKMSCRTLMRQPLCLQSEGKELLKALSLFYIRYNNNRQLNMMDIASEILMQITV